MPAVLKSPRKPKGSGHLRRSEILEAAQRIFAEEGYAGATVRKIAQQVGVSSTAIYLHFPDKRAMLMEIASAALGPLQAKAEAVAQDTTLDAAERARQILLAYMAFARENPSVYAVLMSDAQREITGAADRAKDIFIAYHRSFLGVITELSDQGRLRAPVPHTAAQALWAGCHGVIDVVRVNPCLRWSRYEDLRDTMVDGLLRGLLKD